MKQVRVNGLVVLTAPDRDAHRHAATLIREAALKSGAPITRLIEIEKAAARVEAGVADSFTIGHDVISVFRAVLGYLVPDCEHELYAAGRCRNPRCENYYLRPSETRKDVAA